VVAQPRRHAMYAKRKTAKATSHALSQNQIIIKTMNQSTGQKSRAEMWYVVTRDGRRAWHRDYWTLDEARAHANHLIASLKSYKDPSYKSVVIMETKDPDSIK